jgi:hypothetical protein
MVVGCSTTGAFNIDGDTIPGIIFSADGEIVGRPDLLLNPGRTDLPYTTAFPTAV